MTTEEFFLVNQRLAKQLNDGLRSATVKITAFRRFVDAFIFHYFLTQPNSAKEFDNFRNAYLAGWRKPYASGDEMDRQILAELEKILEQSGSGLENRDYFLSIIKGNDAFPVASADENDLIG